MMKIGAFTRWSIPVLLAILLAAAACGGGQEEGASEEPARLQAVLEETLTLGADQDRPLEELFSSAGIVAAGNDRIYVADRQENQIKIFDSEGRFQRVIGSEGEGPGEFQRIVSMALDHDSTLLVVDQFNGRITRFSPEGEVLQSHAITVTPRLIAPLGKSYLLGYRNGSNAETDSLFHIYDSTFAEEAHAFGALSNHGAADEPFWRLVQGFDPGHAALSTSGQEFVYAPYLYEGELYRYASRPGGWQLEQTLTGHASSERAYELVDYEPPEGMMWQRVYHLSDEYTALLHAVSEGVFRLQDGRIVHLTRRMIGNEHPLYLEVFGEDGHLTGHGRLQWADSSSKWPLSSRAMRVAGKDEQDRFYLIDRSDLPVVRVATLRVEE